MPALCKWYLHLFNVRQADLNWENPAVREELKDILRFWKAKGVKGFRFDVVNLISKGEFVDDKGGTAAASTRTARMCTNTSRSSCTTATSRAW